MTTPARHSSSSRPRALVGPLILVVGTVHVLITPILFGDAVRSIVAGGVLGAVEADPDQAALRGLAFWYATAGIGTLALGWAVIQIERHVHPVPLGLPLVLLGIGLWGLVLMPASPFWAFPVLAVVALIRRHTKRGSIPGRGADPVGADPVRQAGPDPGER